MSANKQHKNQIRPRLRTCLLHFRYEVRIVLNLSDKPNPCSNAGGTKHQGVEVQRACIIYRWQSCPILITKKVPSLYEPWVEMPRPFHHSAHYLVFVPTRKVKKGGPPVDSDDHIGARKLPSFLSEEAQQMDITKALQSCRSSVPSAFRWTSRVRYASVSM